MEYFIQEQDKLVQMGTIKSTKDQALATRVLIPAKGKKKAKDSKQQEKKKQEKPKSSDGGSNPSKDKGKKQEKKKCMYCHKGWNPESAFMKKTNEMMAQLLEKNNIPLLDGARKKEGGSNFENNERCYALVVGCSCSSSFIIDSSSSWKMDSVQDSFLYLHP